MEEYLEQLTSKNRDYFHTVIRQLTDAGKSDEEIKTILEDVVPSIVEKQKSGLTARALLGTPTAYTDQFIEKTTASGKANDKPKNTNKYLMWLDSFLLLMGVLAVVNGAVGIFSKTPQTYGIVTLVLMSAGAAVVMYIMYNNYYKAQTEKNGSRWKSFAILTLAMFAWIAIFILASLLPKSFNPSLSPIATLIIGAAALGIRYLLKKRYNIQSAMDGSQRQN
ncbi:hypothetical protein BG261_04370 [Floricoccus tropicus]|uniref:DUF1129 domain-containing protein n=1 Tax=Floricoccus tropicus TaxID=1859473 RepID=A0A1E8GNA4_9LACT|nr:DUF1129 family protein [Floricoccus tropicus]OFI49113.1 hypothetical protein BG261_04370 [Floricoccus tropicus]